MTAARQPEFQLDWDQSNLAGAWPTGPDSYFMMHRLSEVSVAVTATDTPGRVLEVAAAEAEHSCKLNLRGMESVVVEPSPAMLERARARVDEYGARVALIRGVAETLPLRAHSFDRVLIDSAIDHLAQPGVGIEEMARVLKPDGRLVVTFVNYRSLSVRISRMIYRAARRHGYFAGPQRHLFWDTPVPLEHTFECSLPVLHQLCAPYLELDHAFGVSLGWMVPGWGRFLQRLPKRWAIAVMRGLDRVAGRRPELADFVVSVWRPRRRVRGASGQPTTAAGRNQFPVRRTDLVYASRARAEASYWERIEFGSGFFELLSAGDRDVNEAYTGDPARSWIEDLLARGPFGTAAVLGCDEAGYERFWIERNGSARLDVYELSPGVIRKVRAGLGRAAWPPRRVRFIRADLNFAQLPARRYDVIWSSGCLHHIANLEHLFEQVERALRPGGLFAFRDYVGERRMQFAPDRLARINALMREVPARWRRVEFVAPTQFHAMSPFCGVRSDEILELAAQRFELVDQSRAGALFPLSLAVDLAAIEREAPELRARLRAAEQSAMREPGARPCGVYAVFRARRRAAPAARWPGRF